MNITAKEIANLLGISPSAVSLALNGKPGVSDSTRKMILSKASELGYRNGLPTMEPPKNPSNIRYVIYTNDGNVVREISFHSIILEGIEAHARELGYNVLVSYLNHHECDSAHITALAQDVDGILLLGTEFSTFDSDCENILNTLTCPVIIIDNNLFSHNADCVSSDNLKGAYSAISYLYQHGHRKIGYFSSRQRIPNFDERSQGVDFAVQNLPNLQIERYPVSFSTRKAYEDLCSWLETNPELPTAFFADSDIIAFGAIQAFTQMGYRIPEDISIVGFDDMPACQMISPPLTSIRVKKIQTGSLAMQLLHDRIQKTADRIIPHTSLHITVSTELKERNSVAFPKNFPQKEDRL